VIKKKIAGLGEGMGGGVSGVCGRQDCLEQVYRHIGQFGSHLDPLRSLMAEVLPILDDSEPVHDEIDTIDNLMN